MYIVASSESLGARLMYIVDLEPMRMLALNAMTRKRMRAFVNDHAYSNEPNAHAYAGYETTPHY